MKAGTLIRKSAIIAGIALALILLALGGVWMLSSQRMQRTWYIDAHAVEAATDSASLAYGARVAQMRGCIDCHGENLGGKWVIDDPLVARLYAPNLTSGRGGVGKSLSDEDWERAIRHGVGADGHPHLLMPANEFYYLDEADLAALVGWLKTVPPVDSEEPPPSSVGLLGRLLFLLGEMPLVPAEEVPHHQPHPDAPPPGITAAYGAYLALGCKGCHGQDLSGGPIPGAPPDWPPAADLTPSGSFLDWGEEGFVRAARTGLKPDGTPFQEQMPWQIMQAMTDDELKAMWLFFSSLPPRAQARAE